MVTVLIVEGDPAILQFYRRVLESDSFSVMTATTAAEGRRLYESLAPDLLVANQSLPDADGLEFLYAVLSSPRPPAALLTSDVITPGLIAAAKHFGVRAVIEKRVSPEDFLSSARLALKG